jgi:hypothetical protein
MGPGQAAGNDLSTGEVSELPKNFMLNQMIAGKARKPAAAKHAKCAIAEEIPGGPISARAYL